MIHRVRSSYGRYYHSQSESLLLLAVRPLLLLSTGLEHDLHQGNLYDWQVRAGYVHINITLGSTTFASNR